MPERHLGQILGRFRVDSLIGSGGFAWVYKAWDPDLEIPVALKVLKPQYAGDEKFESRFRREASTAARLRHPNIVKIFAVGKEHGAVYFAMDYLPQNLSDRLEVMTALPEPMLVRMGIDVASALGFAHREGVIHRDIKVDNILFDEHGNAVVADFGIARAVSNYVGQTATNMVVGTPQYFSPEQARGQALDGRADIYSLGVTLFRAATGTLPFNGDDWYEIARQHVEDRPAKPRSINAELSRDVERIILRCLEKEPEDRYPTAEELCHALAGLSGEPGASGFRTLVVPPVEAHAGTMALPVHRRQSSAIRAIRRHRGPLGTAAAVAVGLLIAIPLFNARRQGEAATPPAGATPSNGRAPTAGGTAGTTGAAGTTLPVVERRPAPGLVVRVPTGALLFVNGEPVSAAAGSWRSGELTPGAYELVAALPDAPVGCTSARREQSVVLGDTGVQTVRLYPRGCGWLRLRPTPTVVSYRLTPAGGGTAISGRLVAPDSITLPEGAYALAIEALYCAPYTDTVGVERGKVTRVSPKLICGSGK